MKVFRDLYVHIDIKQINLFIEKIETALDDGWIHDTEAEKKSEGPWRWI